MTDVRDRIDSGFANGDGRLYAELVSGLANGIDTVPALAREIEAPPEIVEEALTRLAEDDVVERTDDGWEIV